MEERLDSSQFSTAIMAFSTVTAALFSGIISFLVCKWQISRINISSEEARLNTELTNILKIQIKYPFLEDTQFTNDWNGDKALGNDKKRLDYHRYDSYCCLLFNFLSQIYDLYKGNIEKIDNFFAVEEVVNIHNKWWQNPLHPRDNIEGYSGGFRHYIDSIILRSKK